MFKAFIPWFVAAVSIVVLSASLARLSTVDKRQDGINHVRKVCEETGMYLTEGYAISCRVLKNSGA